MNDEQLPLVNRDGASTSDSLQQQLSSYHERQHARQKRRHRSKTVGRATVGFLAASLLTLLLVALSWPAQKRNDRELELRSLLDAYENAKNFSGVVRLSHNGQKKLQQAMGLANAPFKQPMQEHSVFPMGAHVQLLTSIAMHQLQEQKVVELGKPVDEYWTVKDWQVFGSKKNRTTASGWCPTVGKKGEECERVTFQHLMYMGSGIQGSEMTGERNLQAMGSFGQQVGAFIDEPLAFKPGTSYKYADENYVLLAYMVEKLSGLTFGEYMEKNIFIPLGLKLTAFDPLAGAMSIRHGLVDQYVQFYAHRSPNNSESESSSGSDSGVNAVVEKHMHHMSTGSCAIYQGLDSSLHGLQSAGKDMHKVYTDLFHANGHHSKLLKPSSIAQIVHTRNPAHPEFAQGIGVDFDEAQPGSVAKNAEWPTKIAFCGSTACSTTCMAMQMPDANMSIVASAFTNDVRLYFPSIDAFHAYKPRDFLEKRESTTEENAFEKNDGEVNTLTWSLLQVFLRFYTADD